jgi:hypothetical protein
MKILYTLFFIIFIQKLFGKKYIHNQIQIKNITKLFEKKYKDNEMYIKNINKFNINKYFTNLHINQTELINTIFLLIN